MGTNLWLRLGICSRLSLACTHHLHTDSFGSDQGYTVTMLIKVKTLTGKEIELDIEQTDKIQRIKERVEEKEGIPPAQQRLIFGGKQMHDEKTAKDFGVEGG